MITCSRKSLASVGGFFAFSLALVADTIHARSLWIGPAGGTQSWFTDSLWDLEGGIPNGIGAEAEFSTDLTSALQLNWVGDLTLSKLLIGDTAASWFRTTVGSTGNRLIFETADDTDAQWILSSALNSLREYVRADVVLRDQLTVKIGNTAGSGLEFYGEISGSGGITKSFLGGSNPTNGVSTVRLWNQSNSYSGQTIIEHGNVEISGSVRKGQNSALGNANSAIILGNANSPTSIVANSAGAGLTIRTLSDESECVFERDIDFSKRAESSNTENWRSTLLFAGDGSGGLNLNKLEISGDIIIGNKTAVINAERQGMEVYITGDIRTWLPTTGANQTAQHFLFNTYTPASNTDGVVAGTIRFSDRLRTYTNPQSLTNGTIIVEGNVGALGTASPIGTSTVALSDGNGGNMMTSELGIRRFFMADAETKFERILTLGNGPNLTPKGAGATYYGSTNINVYNGFVIGGLNTSGVVTYSGNIVSNSVNIGQFKRITLGHNLAVTAETGGTVDFTGQILDSASTDYATRVTVNQLRNHAQLDTNADGVVDARANVAIGTATQGTVRFYANNTYEGGTEVMGGSLLVRNTSGSATGTGMILINAGTKFGGSGIVSPGSNKLELKSGAILTLGDPTVDGGIGQLRVNGDVQLSSTGGTLWDFQILAQNGINPLISDNLLGHDLNWAAILIGTSLSGKNDYLEIQGHLETNSSGDTLVNISLSGADDLEAGMAWNLWDATSTSATTESHFAFDFQGLDTQLFTRGLAFDTSHFANHGILAVAVIPEPSRALLVGLSLLGLLMRRHR